MPLVRRAGIRSRPVSHSGQFTHFLGTSSGFLEKLKMKSAALLACADAMKMNLGWFRIARSQFAMYATWLVMPSVAGTPSSRQR